MMHCLGLMLWITGFCFCCLPLSSPEESIQTLDVHCNGSLMQSISSEMQTHVANIHTLGASPPAARSNRGLLQWSRCGRFITGIISTVWSVKLELWTKLSGLWSHYLVSILKIPEAWGRNGQLWAFGTPGITTAALQRVETGRGMAEIMSVLVYGPLVQDKVVSSY